MKTVSLLGSLTLLAFSLHLSAQDDTEYHRAVYAEINDNLASLRKSKATFKDDPLVFELQGWSKGATLRKIIAKVPGEDGDGTEEYYLVNDKPLFVFRQYSSASAEKGMTTPLIEDRFYFEDGVMFKWLGNDKKSVPADSADFAIEAERLTGNCANFVAAFKSKGAANTIQTTEGIFNGIEEGDYAHWLMRATGGEELSLFILRTDASIEKVLANPQSYIGKKCRVQWRQSLEDIPEAGGKITVEHLLGIEWLGKK